MEKGRVHVNETFVELILNLVRVLGAEIFRNHVVNFYEDDQVHSHTEN